MQIQHGVLSYQFIEFFFFEILYQFIHDIMQDFLNIIYVTFESTAIFLTGLIEVCSFKKRQI